LGALACLRGLDALSAVCYNRGVPVPDVMVEPQRSDIRKAVASGKVQLTDVEAEIFRTTFSFFARESQTAPSSFNAGLSRIWLILAGRGFGKTRTGAEKMREWVKECPLVNMIGATTDDIRDIMIEGDSGIMDCCPPWERPMYRPSLMRLDWPNGAKTLYFTAEQPERLRGKQHMKLWMDELASWKYVQDTYDMAMLGLRLGASPQALITTTPKPIPLLRELITLDEVVITKGSSYENRENLAAAWYAEIIAKYEGTRLGRQELEAELLLDEGLAYALKTGVHIIPKMDIPAWWQRFEAMDYGSTHPTAWGVFAVDNDGNTVVFDMYYSPGLIYDHAKAIWQKRAWWKSSACFGPPDLKHKFPMHDIHGREMSLETEFMDHGIYFTPAQADRRAGYQRVAEALRLDENRKFPVWHPRAGQSGAPRLFLLDTDAVAPLIDQVRNAPLESPDSPISRFPGEAVDQPWESEHGHAHAMLRYGMMSRPGPSTQPEKIPEDPRAEALWRHERRRDRGVPPPRVPYDW